MEGRPFSARVDRFGMHLFRFIVLICKRDATRIVLERLEQVSCCA